MPEKLTPADAGATGADLVTTVETRVVAAGGSGAFDQWVGELRQAVERQPGQRDGTILLVERGGFAHLLYRFDSRHELDRWLRSPECRALDAAARDFSLLRRQIGLGRHLRVDLPNEAAASKWKRALLIWATVTPLLLGLNAVAQATIASWPAPPLDGLVIGRADGLADMGVAAVDHAPRADLGNA